jgi:hypothetical protein
LRIAEHLGGVVGPAPFVQISLAPLDHIGSEAEELTLTVRWCSCKCGCRRRRWRQR